MSVSAVCEMPGNLFSGDMNLVSNDFPLSSSSHHTYSSLLRVYDKTTWLSKNFVLFNNIRFMNFRFVLTLKIPFFSVAMQKSCKPAMLGRMWQASRRALNLEHAPAHQFACSQWQSSPHPSTTYLIYR